MILQNACSESARAAYLLALRLGTLRAIANREIRHPASLFKYLPSKMTAASKDKDAKDGERTQSLPPPWTGSQTGRPKRPTCFLFEHLDYASNLDSGAAFMSPFSLMKHSITRSPFVVESFDSRHIDRRRTFIATQSEPISTTPETRAEAPANLLRRGQVVFAMRLQIDSET